MTYSGKVKGVETNWKVHSRGKRSLCIDFRHEGAVPLIRRLVPGAAVHLAVKATTVRLHPTV